MAVPTDDHQLSALGVRRISIDTDPDDLVLPEESGKRLGWIANWLAQPPFIFGEWGLSRYVDGGLRALFRGSPGTGKTMAAVALARSTDLNLLQVDLSRVVSKYISDTENNIERIFEAARTGNAILLFDEADALLGKRSEVKDAHDRYANVEISHLLRRIEPFEGLAIVTTNRPCDIEPDVLNRIDVLVDFPMPDEAARAILWGKLLAAVKLPQEGGLDVTALAKHELSGAEILRSVRVASLLAAIDEKKLNMQLLQAAAAERLAMREGAKAV